MQKCSICEKSIYGHPHTNVSRVCGSCVLRKSQGGPAGKSLYEVRLDLTKMVTRNVPESQEIKMSDLKVKSNVRNRTILLDGKYPIVFDDDGLGRCPLHLRAALEREMIMKPGRLSIVRDPAPPEVVVEVPKEKEPKEPEKVEVELSEEDISESLDQSEPKEPEKVEVELSEEDISESLDQSFLTEEPESKKPAKKVSKKKK